VGAASASILVIVAIGDCYFRRFIENAAQVFQAFEKMRYTAGLNTLTSLLRLIVVASLVVSLHHTTARAWSIAACLVSFLGALAALVMVFIKVGAPSFKPSLMRRHGLEGLGFSVACSTGSIYNDVDKTMLSHYGMTVANGIYTMAYRVVDICAIPITSIQGAMLPRYFKEGAAGGVVRSYALARRVVSKTFLCGMVAALGMLLAAPLIPHVLGPSFAPSVQVVRWLSLLPLFRSLHLSAGDGLLAGGYQKVRFSLQFTAALANFGVNLYLIPRYSWQGAAASSLATDGMLGVASWAALYWLKRNAEERTESCIRVEMDETPVEALG
jgi:O-antigen/teichoic acid export membrane protein